MADPPMVLFDASSDGVSDLAAASALAVRRHCRHNANLSLSRAAVVVCIVVAGLTGFLVVLSTPGTRCIVVVLSIFVADLVDDTAAAPIAAVGFAVGTPLGAVAGV